MFINKFISLVKGIENDICKVRMGRLFFFGLVWGDVLGRGEICFGVCRMGSIGEVERE